MADWRLAGFVEDPALERRVNAELRAPLDALIALAKQRRRLVPCGTTPTEIGTETRVGLRGPRLVSVRYFQYSDWCQRANGSPGGEVASVDLRTGRRLAASDVFRPGTLTAAGVRTLRSRVVQRYGRRVWSDCMLSGGWKPADFFPTGPVNTPGAAQAPPRLSAYLTATEFRLAWFNEGSDGCGDLDFGAPYAKVRDLLKPGFAALLPK